MGRKVREGYYSEQIRNEAFALVDLNESQQRVFDIINLFGPIANEGIAEILHCYPHTVTPRVLELREMGVVEFCGESVSVRSKRRISLWRVNPNGTQLSLFMGE